MSQIIGFNFSVRGECAMKLVVVGSRGYPGVIGGVETHCQELYTRIKKLRPEDEIYVLGRSKYLGKNSYDVNGVKMIPLWSADGKHFEAISHTFLAILYARFKVKADILHVHAIGPGLLVPFARLLGLKVVLTHHGEDYVRSKWNIASKLVLKTGEFLSVAFANEVIVVGDSLTKKLQSRFGRPEKIRFIPNGFTS